MLLLTLLSRQVIHMMEVIRVGGCHQGLVHFTCLVLRVFMDIKMKMDKARYRSILATYVQILMEK
jgi:hypothetical protein